MYVLQLDKFVQHCGSASANNNLSWVHENLATVNQNTS